jgi:chitinase
MPWYNGDYPPSYKNQPIYLVIFVLFYAVPGTAQNIIAYYTGNGQDMDSYPLNKLTHIIHAFGHLRGDQMSVTAGDSAAIRRLVRQKRKYPALKVLLSLGGWEGCNSCAAVFVKPAGRKAFARSVVRLLDQFNADGIDIDWEFPDRAENFTALMQTLRDSLQPDKELSFIAAAFAPYLKSSYDWPQLMRLVTRVNLMTYDLIGSRSPITGHHAALYPSGPQLESVDHAIQYLDSLNVPHSRIAIGAAFYARQFDHVRDSNNGLFQPGHFKRFLTLNQCRRLSGYRHYWDPQAQAAYSYNSGKKIFLTYDDARSVAAKARYIRQKNLDGIMYWKLSLDPPRGSLLDTLYKTLHPQSAPGL